MAVTVPEMLKMSQAQLDDLFTQSPVGEIPKRRGQRHRDRRTGDDLHAGHREFHKPFCVAGKKFRSRQRGFAKQDFAFRTERDHRQGLQGSELDGQKRVHRPRLFRDFAGSALGP